MKLTSFYISISFFWVCFSESLTPEVQYRVIRYTETDDRSRRWTDWHFISQWSTISIFEINGSELIVASFFLFQHFYLILQCVIYYTASFIFLFFCRNACNGIVYRLLFAFFWFHVSKIYII